MFYQEIEVSRSNIRSCLLEQLRINLGRLTLPEPPNVIGADRRWISMASAVGITFDELVNEIFDRLLEEGQAIVTQVPVSDSTIMNARNAYIPFHIKIVILEELYQLIRMGILLPVSYERLSEMSFDLRFVPTSGSVTITQFGARYLSEEPIPPHFTEPYLERLRNVAEPDEELQGYLSEGLACLRNHLPRSSAILLRLAAEHILSLLIASTELAILDRQVPRDNFRRDLNRVRTSLLARAEVVFERLETMPDLLPEYFLSELRNRLRPAFHSIRSLGNNAAHISAHIQIEEVAENYTLYASSVYSIIMMIISHQESLQIAD